MMRPSCELQTLTFHETMKFEKACHKRLYLSGVRDTSTPSSRQEHRQHIQYQETFAETRTVNYLILYLMVTQTIITLKKQDLEHQQSIGGRPALLFALSGKRADSRVGRKISKSTY